LGDIPDAAGIDPDIFETVLAGLLGEELHFAESYLFLPSACSLNYDWLVYGDCRLYDIANRNVDCQPACGSMNNTAYLDGIFSVGANGDFCEKLPDYRL
jgi:hypothetical protein